MELLEEERNRRKIIRDGKPLLLFPNLLLNKLSKLPKTYCSGEDREPEAGLERDSKSEPPLLFHLRYSIITPASQFTKNKLHHGHMLLKQCPQVGSTVNMRHQAGGGDVKVKR